MKKSEARETQRNEAAGQVAPSTVVDTLRNPYALDDPASAPCHWELNVLLHQRLQATGAARPSSLTSAMAALARIRARPDR